MRGPPPARKNSSSAAARRRASRSATSAFSKANIEGLETLSARRTLHPARVLPKPSRDIPELYGVRPSYSVIHSLHLAEGRFFDESDDDASATVCVLGEGAKVNMLGYGPALGKFVKVNDTWLEVVGVLSEQLMAGVHQSAAAPCRTSTTSSTSRSTRSSTAIWDQSSST